MDYLCCFTLGVNLACLQKSFRASTVGHKSYQWQSEGTFCEQIINIAITDWAVST